MGGAATGVTGRPFALAMTFSSSGVRRARAIRSAGVGCDPRSDGASRGGSSSARLLRQRPSSARANASGSPATSKPNASAARSRRREYGARAARTTERPTTPRHSAERGDARERARAAVRERVGQAVDEPRADAERHERRDRSDRREPPEVAGSVVAELVSEHGAHLGDRAVARGAPRRRAACRSAGSGASARCPSRRRWPQAVLAPASSTRTDPTATPARAARASRSSRSVPGRERPRAQEQRQQQHRRDRGQDAARAAIDPAAAIAHHQRGSTRASQTTSASAGAPSTSAISQPFERSPQPAADALPRDARTRARAGSARTRTAGAGARRRRRRRPRRPARPRRAGPGTSSASAMRWPASAASTSSASPTSPDASPRRRRARPYARAARCRSGSEGGDASVSAGIVPEGYRRACAA